METHVHQGTRKFITQYIMSFARYKVGYGPFFVPAEIPVIAFQRIFNLDKQSDITVVGDQMMIREILLNMFSCNCCETFIVFSSRRLCNIDNGIYTVDLSEKLTTINMIGINFRATGKYLDKLQKEDKTSVNNEN